MTATTTLPPPAIRQATPDDADALSTFLSHIYLSTYGPHFGTENVRKHFTPILTPEVLHKALSAPEQTVHIATTTPKATTSSDAASNTPETLIEGVPPIVGMIQTREEAIPTQYLFPSYRDTLSPPSGDPPDAQAPDNTSKAHAFAYVARLYVHEVAHGTGLARTLLSLAESKVVGEGYRRIWLTVLGANARAVRFYEKSGYELVGEKVVTEKDEDEGGHWAPRKDLVMVKRL